MTTLENAARMALEALEEVPIECDFHGNPVDEAFESQLDITVEALRQALEQPVREWVGLTEEEVRHQWEVWRASLPRYVGFAHAIEAKLKEKNT